MGTTQFKISKEIRYETDFPIKHNKLFQIVENEIYFEKRKIISEHDLPEDLVSKAENLKYYSMYSYFKLLEYLS